MLITKVNIQNQINRTFTKKEVQVIDKHGKTLISNNQRNASSNNIDILLFSHHTGEGLVSANPHH